MCSCIDSKLVMITRDWFTGFPVCDGGKAGGRLVMRAALDEWDVDLTALSYNTAIKSSAIKSHAAIRAAVEQFSPGLNRLRKKCCLPRQQSGNHPSAAKAEFVEKLL